MPYKVQKVKGGYKVVSPNGPKSSKPLSKEKAEAQQRAIYANAPPENEPEHVKWAKKVKGNSKS